jgi:dTDP-glucose pyrophosphorylase
MKAVILAAGVGSRLRPFTKNCQKSWYKLEISEYLITKLKDIFKQDLIKKIFALLRIDGRQNRGHVAKVFLESISF